jgi:hypothetical protein
MHQLGKCPGALKTLSLQRRRGGLFGRAAFGATVLSTPGGVRPPNPRVQRTRVARCARPGSPLTRHPLGDVGEVRSPESHLPPRSFPVGQGLRVGGSSRGSWVVGRAASESVAFVASGKSSLWA